MLTLCRSVDCEGDRFNDGGGCGQGCAAATEGRPARPGNAHGRCGNYGVAGIAPGHCADISVLSSENAIYTEYLACDFGTTPCQCGVAVVFNTVICMDFEGAGF